MGPSGNADIRCLVVSCSRRDGTCASIARMSDEEPTEFLRPMLALDDTELEVVNAFAFSMSCVHLVVSATNEDEGLDATALLRVRLGTDGAHAEIVHEFNSTSLDYLADDERSHTVLASGGYLHRLVHGTHAFHMFPDDASYLPRLGRLDPATLLSLGDDGQVFAFRDGRYTRLDTGIEAHLRAFTSGPDGAYVGGDEGTLLRWNGTSFEPVSLEIDSGAAIASLHARADGAVAIGCEHGLGFVLENGKLTRLAAHSADLKSVTSFRGVEYWGDDDFGVYSREGAKLKQRFETGYAFHLHATQDVMTVNAGYDVYLFDGATWVRVTLEPDPDVLVKRDELDFEPR